MIELTYCEISTLLSDCRNFEILRVLDYENTTAEKAMCMPGSLTASFNFSQQRKAVNTDKFSQERQKNFPAFQARWKEQCRATWRATGGGGVEAWENRGGRGTAIPEAGEESMESGIPKVAGAGRN